MTSTEIHKVVGITGIHNSDKTVLTKGAVVLLEKCVCGVVLCCLVLCCIGTNDGIRVSVIRWCLLVCVCFFCCACLNDSHQLVCQNTQQSQCTLGVDSRDERSSHATVTQHSFQVYHCCVLMLVGCNEQVCLLKNSVKMNLQCMICPFFLSY